MSKGLCPLLPEEGHNLDRPAVQRRGGPWELPWALTGHSYGLAGPLAPAFAIGQPLCWWSWFAPEGPLPTSWAPKETGKGGRRRRAEVAGSSQLPAHPARPTVKENSAAVLSKGISCRDGQSIAGCRHSRSPGPQNPLFKIAVIDYHRSHRVKLWNSRITQKHAG